MKNPSSKGKLSVRVEQKAEFCKLLTGLAELYGKSVSSTLLEIYWRSIEKYSIQEINCAISIHISNPDVGQFMPKPADLVRWIEGKHEDKAFLAWAKVLNAMRVVGMYESIIFDDPVIHAVIDKLGGWIKFCQTLDKNLHYLAEDFKRSYLACLIYERPKDTKRLIGMEEHFAGLSGRRYSKPIVFKQFLSEAQHEEENNDDKDYKTQQSRNATKISSIKKSIESEANA